MKDIIESIADALVIDHTEILSENNVMRNRIKELEAAEKQAAEHVLAMAEAVASVEAENQRLRDEVAGLKRTIEQFGITLIEQLPALGGGE